MPRYLIERAVGDVTRGQLAEVVERATRVREERFPDIAWLHTHVVRTDEGLTAYCVYQAASPDRVSEHAEAIGLPAQAIHEIEAELTPTKG
jgi:Protein of unknown function (DUF4242)